VWDALAAAGILPSRSASPCLQACAAIAQSGRWKGFEFQVVATIPSHQRAYGGGHRCSNTSKKAKVSPKAAISMLDEYSLT